MFKVEVTPCFGLDGSIQVWEGAVYVDGEPKVAMIGKGLAGCFENLALAWREHLAGDRFTGTPPPSYPEGA